LNKNSIPLFALCAILVLAAPSWATEPADASGSDATSSEATSSDATGSDATGSFDIERFQVDGEILLKPSTIQSIVARFTGKSRDSKDIDQAIKALEAAYHKRGFILAKVVLVDRIAAEGVVHLQVIQPRIGKVRISGNNFHSEANIRRSLPDFTEGVVPNTTDLSVDIRIANENPSKKAVPQLQEGADADTVDAAIQITDEKPWSAGAVLDNSGVGLPGRTHITAQYQNYDLWGLDHTLSLQYTTSTEHPSDIKIYSFGYEIPLYAHRDSLDFYGSYSNVNSGQISAGLESLTVSGAGTVVGAHFTHNLPQLGIYNSQLVAGFDRKAFRNVMNPADPNLASDVTVDPLNLSYMGQWVMVTGNANVYLTVVRNVPGGSQGADSNFAIARAGATRNYGMLKYGASYTRILPGEWSLRLATNAQATHDALITGEEFGVGGATSVRGLEERQLLDDGGLASTAEIYTPNLCAFMQGNNAHCNLLGFIDDGHLSRNDVQPGEAAHISVASTGVGIRVTEGRTLALQMDYGQVFSTSDATARGDRRLHAYIALTF
jgi:hemolysin activation/secretion protein